MKITYFELENIKKVYGFDNYNQVYEQILKIFPEDIFYDDVDIMEIINEAKEMLLL